MKPFADKGKQFAFGIMSVDLFSDGGTSCRNGCSMRVLRAQGTYFRAR